MLLRVVKFKGSCDWSLLIWNWYCRSSSQWNRHAKIASWKNKIISMFWFIPCVIIVIITSNARYVIMTQYWICFRWKTNIKDVTIIAIKLTHPVYTDMLFSYSSSSQLGCILLPSWFLFCKENNKNTEYFMIVISFKSFTSSTCVFPVSSLTPYVKSKQFQNMKLKRKKINLKSISVMRAKIWTRFDEPP